MLSCASFDEAALTDFIDDYRGPQGDAPEKFEPTSYSRAPTDPRAGVAER